MNYLENSTVYFPFVGRPRNHYSLFSAERNIEYFDRTIIFHEGIPLENPENGGTAVIYLEVTWVYSELVLSMTSPV